jgi:hypothetical protein
MLTGAKLQFLLTVHLLVGLLFVSFTTSAIAAPVITSVTPSSINRHQGGTITITGTGFGIPTGRGRVSLTGHNSPTGGSVVTIPTSWTDTQIVTQIPACPSFTTLVQPGCSSDTSTYPRGDLSTDVWVILDNKISLADNNNRVIAMSGLTLKGYVIGSGPGGSSGSSGSSSSSGSQNTSGSSGSSSSSGSGSANTSSQNTYNPLAKSGLSSWIWGIVLLVSLGFARLVNSKMR